MYWQRVPGAALAASPGELWRGVPVFADPGYDRALADGTLLAVAQHYLLLEVLFAGGSTDPAAGLVVSGGSWYPVDPAGASDDEVGLLTAGQVRAVSDFLRGADPERWIPRREAELAAVLRGYDPRPWDAARAGHLARLADDLSAFYHRAAADGDAVVKVLVG
jgi:hypothetical protein